MKRKNITIQDAKKMNIEYPLQLSGITPVKKYNGYGMYYAFDRKEATPSLKVDYNKNLYYDFGTAKGGDIISLVQLMNKCSVSEALSFLSGNETVNPFFFHQQNTIEIIKKEQKTYAIQNIKTLENSALIDYLTTRGIDKNISLKYCKEIHYKINGKKYFSIGFKNDLDGYAIRNKYYKGALLKQGITHLKNESKSVIIFEGFIDFLSYLTMYKNDKNKEDFIILNSTSLLKNAIPIIAKYDIIHCYLDNDNTGKKAFKTIKENYNHAIDCFKKFSEFNDLNEYLIFKNKNNEKL